MRLEQLRQRVDNLFSDFGRPIGFCGDPRTCGLRRDAPQLTSGGEQLMRTGGGELIPYGGWSDELTRSLGGKPLTLHVDVVEEPNKYVINAEIPGVEKKDIKVDVDGDRLTLSAERREEVKEEDKDRRFVRQERTYGSVSRTFTLPPDADHDPAHIRAVYDKGMLKLELPRTESKAAKKAQIAVQ